MRPYINITLTKMFRLKEKSKVIVCERWITTGIGAIVSKENDKISRIETLTYLNTERSSWDGSFPITKRQKMTKRNAKHIKGGAVRNKC